ncbi:hypothetical protein E6O75_ATG02671 [Venturia nashicola]|uniref:Uncharacterized protein n=1 Tax=Venturia nashicola TaxID=86259 RepID=A0A4Z1PG69_9PEZI|nr:hypothetical protein E6O75_ATG02671 [Venturia nashicola]
MDPHEWRRMRRGGERQPGNGQRHRGPIDPRAREMMAQETMQNRMERMNMRGINRNGYLGGGPQNRGNHSSSHEQDEIMQRQIDMERAYNHNRPTGGYGIDRLGRIDQHPGIDHPGERRNRDPRARIRLRNERAWEEHQEGDTVVPGEHSPRYDFGYDPSWHRGGVGSEGPRLSGGGPRGMDPLQHPLFRRRDEYLRRNDGAMDSRIYDGRMDGPRWIRR